MEAFHGLSRRGARSLAILVASGLVAASLAAPRLAARQDAQQGTNSMCPVLVDEKVDPTKFTDYQGRRIYFCCSKCIRKFEAAPADYLGNLPQSTSPPAVAGDESGSRAAPDGAPVESHAAAPPAAGVEHGPSPHESMVTPAHGHHGGAMQPSEGAGHEEQGVLSHFVDWLGRFHPMVVHFPIALLMAAALAELLSMSGRLVWAGSSARFCIALGALIAIAAAALGWARATGGDFPPSTADAVEVHRWFGTTTALWMVACAACSEVGRRAPRRWMALYRFFLFTGVALIGLTGHFGAVITHGPDYYVW